MGNIRFVIVWFARPKSPTPSCTPLLLQGRAIRPVARCTTFIVASRIGSVDRVGLDLPGRSEHELIVCRVISQSPVLRGDRLPRCAHHSLVVRYRCSMRLQWAGHLKENDLLGVSFAPTCRIPIAFVASPRELSQDDAEFLGTRSQFYEPRHQF